jgi:hypothetical protein
MPEVTPSRYLVTCSWDDVPHLSEAVKAELLRSVQPHLRKARSQGIPSLGAGAIYPIPEEDVICTPFAIPDHWRKAYGMDVGWNNTAALWLAEDPSDGTLYAYAEHKRGEAPPLIHATSIKARGEWIPGAIDPASMGAGQIDGRKLFALYVEQGLHLTLADNAVEEGIYRVWERLETGRLRIFSTLGLTREELRVYRRDEKGKIVKVKDHLMDCLRYGVSRFEAIATRKPVSSLRLVSAPGDSVVNY